MKRGVQISVAILLLGITSYVSYNLIMNWHNKEIETAKREVREELTLSEKPVVPKEKLIEAFGKDPTEAPLDKQQTDYEEIERRMIAFFSYLDSQEYVKSYKLQNGTYHEFQLMVNKLSSNPPIVIGETESLYTLYKNMSHMYKVLGKMRVSLIKDVLSNESGLLESAAKTFFAWFAIENSIDRKQMKRPSLKVLYEYSGFFLNTLAGKSYLLRRDATVRILATYYCVLILDRANDAKLNANGIDIRPFIKALSSDISYRSGFINKEQYLSELERLSDKYQL